MTKFAVAILLLALTMPACAEDINSANYFLPGCKGTLDPASSPHGTKASVLDLLQALYMRHLIGVCRKG
jgi:hypothetical protein